jgi:glutamyl-tRNA reductase
VSVLACGLNYRTAPIGLLERLAVPAEQLPKALRSLTSRPYISEAVVLSTCNRVEVYAHVGRYHGGMADIRNHFAEWSGGAPEDITDLVYDYYDEGAARHLFAVASGLDSMVVGERQIQLQVKQAFAEAEAEGAAAHMLHTLFRQALRVGKRTRAETGISAGASSMVDVGLQAAERVVGDLSGRTILIVGAGKMGGMAATRLADRAGRIMVANRGAPKRARLAARVGAEQLDLDALRRGLADADLVLSSTGAAQPLIDRDTLAGVMAQRGQRPLALLDLAVPRDVDPGCGDLPGVTVLDVDAVRALAEGGRTGEEVAKARELVRAEAARFASWTRGMRVEPTISALRGRAEQVRQAEIARLGPRFADLDDRERAALDALTKGIVNTLLHDPTVRLKAIADARGGEDHATMLRELFDLPEHD